VPRTIPSVIGRPPGEFRQLTRAALAAGEGTARQIAERTGMSVGAARTALDNARRAGEAHVVRYERAGPGRRGRLAVYAQTVVGPEAAQPAPADGGARLATMLGEMWR